MGLTATLAARIAATRYEDLTPEHRGGAPPGAGRHRRRVAGTQEDAIPILRPA